MSGIIGTNKFYQFTVQVEDSVKSCWLVIVWWSPTQRNQVRGIFSWYKKEAFFENERGQWFDAPKLEWGSENVDAHRTTYSSHEVSIIPQNSRYRRVSYVSIRCRLPETAYIYRRDCRYLYQRLLAFTGDYWHLCQFLLENGCLCTSWPKSNFLSNTV